jgi:hypothetical protein
MGKAAVAEADGMERCTVRGNIQSPLRGTVWLNDIMTHVAGLARASTVDWRLIERFCCTHVRSNEQSSLCRGEKHLTSIVADRGDLLRSPADLVKSPEVRIVLH